MRRTKLTSILFALIIVTGLSSCGGDDNQTETNVVSGTSPVTNVPTFTTGTCESASSYDDFVSRVNNYQFIAEFSNYETYYYQEQRLDRNERELFGFIPYNSSSWDNLGQFSRTSSKGSADVSHEAGSSKENVRNYLMDIINRKVQQRGGGSYFEILTNTGEVFGISLCVPIGANPVYRWSETSQERYFYIGTSANSSNSSFGFFN